MAIGNPDLAISIAATGDEVDVSHFSSWSVIAMGNFTTQPVISAVGIEEDGTKTSATLLTFTGLTGANSVAIMHSPAGNGITTISGAFVGGSKLLVIGKRLTEVF